MKLRGSAFAGDAESCGSAERANAAIGRDFRRRRPAPSKGAVSRHLNQPNQSLRHSMLSERPQTGSAAPADEVTTPALTAHDATGLKCDGRGCGLAPGCHPGITLRVQTLPSGSHRRTGTYEQQEAEARDQKVQREAEGARERPIYPAWSAD